MTNQTQLFGLVVTTLLFFTLLLPKASWAQDTWQRIGPSNAIIDAVISFRDGQKILAGTTGQGVQKSTDLGVTWSPMGSTGSVHYSSMEVKSLATSANGDIVFAGTDTGIYKSSDGGATWDRVGGSTFLYTPFVTALATSRDGQVVYAGTWDKGVFKSSDGGMTWVAAHAGISSLDILSLAMHADTQNLLVGTKGGGVFHSSNGGQSWGAVNTGITNPYVNTVAIHTDGRTFFAGTRGGGIFKSTNGGASWGPVNTGLDAATWIHTMALHTDGLTLLAGTDNGVYKTVNGGNNWVALNLGLPGQQVVRALAIHSDGNAYIVGTDGQGLLFKRSTAPEPQFVIPQGNLRPQDISIQASTLNGKRTVSGTLNMANQSAWAGGTPPNARISVFVLAMVPGTITGGAPIFIAKDAFWGWSFVNSQVPALFRDLELTANTGTVPLDMISDMSATGLVGVEIYVGYGVSFEEMVASGRYRGVYRFE